MNKRKKYITNILCVMLVSACFLALPANARASSTVKVKVGGKAFNAVFYNNKTANQLLKKMTFTYKMTEFNGNEKYKYLSYGLPQNEKSVGQIKAGDIMLYGSDCLVVFYKTFSTGYRYTRIGRISNPAGLEQAVGTGTAKITFVNKSIRLSKKKITLRTGKSKKIKLYTAIAGKVKWKSSNKAVAIVKGGRITGRKPGKAVVTARYRNKKYSCKVTVKK